jgi:PhnB protein
MSTKVQRVPEGFHTITPHITVADAAKAIHFYQRAFGAELVSRMEGPGGKVMHAEVRIGDSLLFLNDEFPQMGARSPKSLGGTSMTIHLTVEDCDGLFRRATQAGAEVVMPLNDMFWGDRYGMVQDPDGYRWAIASHIEDVSPEECARRGAEAMKKGCGG